MGKGIRQQVGDRRDNNRIFAWGIAVVIFLVVVAVVISAFFWRSDPTPAIADTAIRRASPVKRAAKRQSDRGPMEQDKTRRIGGRPFRWMLCCGVEQCASVRHNDAITRWAWRDLEGGR